MSLPSLNAVQDHFLKVFDLGRVALSEDTHSLFELLVTLEMVLAGLYIALGSRADLSSLAQKVIKVGIFYWIITKYEELLQVLLDGFLDVGVKASGATGLNTGTLQNPDAIIERAFKIVTPAFEKVFQLQGESYLGLPTLDNILVLLCVSVGFLALISLALQVFLTYVEFMIISAIGFILVPLAICKPLSFLTEKFFAAIISFGIKLLVLAVVVGASTSIMDEMVLSTSLTWQEMWNFLLISLALFVISFHAPAMAQTMLFGSPSLSAGQIAPAVISTSNQMKAIGGPALKHGAASPVGRAITAAGVAQGAYSKSREGSASKAASLLYGVPKGLAQAAGSAAVGSTASKVRSLYKYGQSIGSKK